MIKNRKTKYNKNVDFFKNPETWEPNQAYFLGWLMSDGHHNLNKGISIKLQESDKRILELLKEIINYNGPLIYEKRNSVNKLITDNSYHWQNRWALTIYQKTFTPDLLSLGISNNKSNSLYFPDYLRDDLISHFLRGYYEGDGTISYCYGDKKNPKRLLFEIHLICTPMFIKPLQTIFKKIDIRTRITTKSDIKNGNVYLKFSGNLAALKFFNYVYRDSQVLLKRKFRKFLRLINHMKRKQHVKNKLQVEMELSKAIHSIKWIILNSKY